MVLIKKRSLPKTTSGKVQRFLCKQQLKEKKLKIISEWDSDSDAKEIDADQLISQKEDVVSLGVGALNSTQFFVKEIWQEVLSLEHIHLHDNFFELGGAFFRGNDINQHNK